MTDPDLELVSIERHVLETLEECVRKGVCHSDAADAAWEALAPKPEQDWRQERADKITWPRKGLLLCPECNAEPWTDCENCKGRGVIDPSTTRDAVPPSIADMAPGTTFSEGVRWTVARDLHGNTFLYRDDKGYGTVRFPDQIDPSTIRDVKPPSITENTV